MFHFHEVAQIRYLGEVDIFLCMCTNFLCLQQCKNYKNRQWELTIRLTANMHAVYNTAMSTSHYNIKCSTVTFLLTCLLVPTRPVLSTAQRSHSIS